MGDIQFMSEEKHEEFMGALLVCQKLDYAAKHGCPAGFFTSHDLQDTQRAFGITTEINNERL